MKIKIPESKIVLEFLDSKKALVLCAFIAAVLAIMSGSHKTPNKVQVDRSVDTLIPAGYVLVPIEVQNYEALDSILGSYGYVDLFLPSQKAGEKGIRVASRVKIMRAPLNPSQFAVLVPDDQSGALVRSDSPFFVVVQNAKQTGTGFVTGSPQPARKHFSRVVVEAE